MKEHIRTAFMECIDSHHDKGFSFSEPELLDCCTYTYLGLQEKERDEKQDFKMPHWNMTPHFSKGDQEIITPGS